MTDQYTQAFEQQKSYKFKARNSTASYRLGKLRKFKKLLISKKAEIATALSKDFHKPLVETDLTEIMPILSMINLLEKKLPLWMSDKKESSPLLFKGSKNWVRREGKGNCLILSPWNYPFQLAIYPILTAFAAGNTCILKPSEYTPETNKVVIELLSLVFTPEEVVVFEGDAQTSTELLKFPFDHIFFTGSTPVGKIVMEAASKNLASVSLELGGKSPVFVDRKVDLDKTAKKIMWGKFVNGGQTCVAPDYILIHKDDESKFIQSCKKYIKEFYGEKAEESDDYNQIITDRHGERLKKLVEQAIGAGAKLECGGDYIEQKRILSPTILSNIDKNMALMEDEIFGPVLPIVNYSSINDAIDFINEYDNALAMYIFSDSKETMNTLMQNTSNGGVTINDVLLAVGHPTLPFGGAGKSGLGRYHGEYGFEDFSHLRSVMRRDIDLGTSYFYPPYTPKKASIVNSLLEKFSSLF